MARAGGNNGNGFRCADPGAMQALKHLGDAQAQAMEEVTDLARLAALADELDRIECEEMKRRSRMRDELRRVSDLQSRARHLRRDMVHVLTVLSSRVSQVVADLRPAAAYLDGRLNTTAQRST